MRYVSPLIDFIALKNKVIFLIFKGQQSFYLIKRILITLTLPLRRRQSQKRDFPFLDVKCVCP